jgi:hypothetical protein
MIFDTAAPPKGLFSRERGGEVVYRCRLCGGENRNTHVPCSLWAAMAMTVGGALRSFEPKGSMGVPVFETHRCPDGSIGIAEIVGFTVDAPPKETET